MLAQSLAPGHLMTYWPWVSLYRPNTLHCYHTGNQAGIYSGLCHTCSSCSDRPLWLPKHLRSWLFLSLGLVSPVHWSPPLFWCHLSSRSVSVPRWDSYTRIWVSSYCLQTTNPCRSAQSCQSIFLWTDLASTVWLADRNCHSRSDHSTVGCCRHSVR